MIGVDPGKKGGLAVLDGRSLLKLQAMPLVTGKGRDEYDANALADWLCMYAQHDAQHDAPHVFVEKLQPLPAFRARKGKPGQPAGPPEQMGGTIANYNRGAATWLFIGICAGLAIPCHLVAPQAWQRVMLEGTSGSDTKQRSIVAATRLFPGVSFLPTTKSKKPSDGLTDAALLAEYGRRKLAGDAGAQRGLIA